MSASLGRRGLGAVSIAAFVAATMMPSVAAAVSDKPKIPNEPVLSVYNETLALEKLGAIAPVSTGTAALTQTYGPRALDDPRLNPGMYRGTIDILRRYVQLIAEKGPRKDVVPNVELERNDMINAIAKDQEAIVLTTGLVDRITSNIRDKNSNLQQLIFTLSHEYSHILYDHPRRFAQKSKPAGAAKLLGTALVVAAVINDVTSKDGKSGAIDPKAIGTMQVAFAMSPLIEMEIYRAVYAPYQKKNESLADFAAVDLMWRLEQGDPRQACTWLLDLEKYDNSLKAQLQSGLKQLGNNFKASMADMALQAPGLLVDAGPRAVLDQAKENVLRVALQTAGRIILRRFDKKRVHVYYSADKRVDAIKAYADKFYPPRVEEATAATVSAWATKNRVPDPARFADMFERENGPDKAASAAKMRLIENDITGARTVLDGAKARFATLGRSLDAAPAPAAAKGKAGSKGKNGNAKAGDKGVKTKAQPATSVSVIPSAYFHMIDGQTYMAEGRTAEAATALNLATLQPMAPLSAFQMLASVQTVLGRKAAVLATLDRAEAIFGEERVILLKIRHFVATDDRAKAEALAAQCAKYRDLADRCQQSLALLDKSDEKEDADDRQAADDAREKSKARPRKDDDDDD